MSLQAQYADSNKSWSVDVSTIDTTCYDLSVKKPSSGEVIEHRGPLEIMDEIAALDAESAMILASLRGLV